MVNRRIVLALPLLLAVPALAQPADTLAAALVACWQARGIRFAAGQVAARIGGRTGRDALLAVAGAAISADEDEVETAVEIVWEAGQTPSPAEPLLVRDLAGRLPALVLGRDGQWWLLHARHQEQLGVSHPLTGENRMLTLDAVTLIGRPVISGA